MSFTLKIALSWIWDLIIAPFVVIWGHSSVVEHSTADQEVTCFFCLSAKDKWIVFTLHFSEKVMWLLFGKINVAFVKLIAHKLWAKLNITGYEKRNSFTNCQLLTYLKAQHHFTSICWPLGVFFHVIQLEELAFIAVWSTISFPKPNVLDERGTGGSVVESSPATREARVRFPASAKQSPKETCLCFSLSNWLKPLDDISWIRFCWEARVSECSGNGCLKFGSETSEFLTNGKVQRTLRYFVVWWGVIVKD